MRGRPSLIFFAVLQCGPDGFLRKRAKHRRSLKSHEVRGYPSEEMKV